MKGPPVEKKWIVGLTTYMLMRKNINDDAQVYQQNWTKKNYENSLLICLSFSSHTVDTLLHQHTIELFTGLKCYSAWSEGMDYDEGVTTGFMIASGGVLSEGSWDGGPGV